MMVFAQALELVFQPHVLAVILGSACFGMFVGAIPGLSATMATALLVPVTFFMDPVPAIASIVTATAMAIFAGDIPGALLRMPGTPASVAPWGSNARPESSDRPLTAKDKGWFSGSTKKRLKEAWKLRPRTAT